jgi:nitrate/TMAO reductase-like tetraheme cytochrome c subunit
LATLHPTPLTFIALVCAVLSAGILAFYLVRRPPLTLATKIALLLGLGVFPIGVAAAGNIEGFQATEKREFCGSCHVMVPHAQDSEDRMSSSLSSRHARNKLFGNDNCYMCHADYGMYGTVMTKMGGMRHVWLYYTQYRTVPIEEAKNTIHLREPFPNDNCMQCHSTEDLLWLKLPDHRAALDDVRADRVSCACVGCHGLAHPNFRPASPSGRSASLSSPDGIQRGGAR